MGIGRRSLRSKFVRFERTIALEFRIPVLRASTVLRLKSLIPTIQHIAENPPKTLWPQSVSSSISRALQELEVEDFYTSRVVEAGRTGLISDWIGCTICDESATSSTDL